MKRKNKHETHIRSRKTLHSLALILFLAAIDQVTKILVINHFKDSLFYKHLKISSFLNLIEGFNKGMAFGLFNSATYANFIFIATTIAICIFMFVLLQRSRKNIDFICYSLIIGGAFGNLVDRFKYNAVYDFIDFHIKDWHWYTFNLADSFISVGAVLFIISMFRFKSDA